ncbi:hypothetical protein LCGC14_0755050 [marine sediment metagenome]|uniref:Uncharacterized protein n=1 Tax=marine sediment metagenome TaxID=412755 RepID=A0A0F9SN16_9ZZZZ
MHDGTNRTDAKPKSITARMAAVLTATIVDHGPANLEPRTTAALLRRGLLDEAAEPGRQYRPTQLGREALGHHVGQQPGVNIIVVCRYWTDFYGFHAELRYWDDPDHPVLIEWNRTFARPELALEFLLRCLLEQRGLLLACCPELHDPNETELTR